MPFDTGDVEIRAVAVDRAGHVGKSAPIDVSVQATRMTTPTLTLENSNIPWRSHYFLPVKGFWGVFGVQSAATRPPNLQMQKLHAKFFPATLVRTSIWRGLSPQRYWIVMIGPYDKQDDALKSLAIAQTLGFKGMRVQWSGARR